MSVAIEEKLPIQIGIDVGQITDPSSVCVAECSQVDTGKVRYDRVQTLAHFDDRGVWIPATGIEPVVRTEYTVRFIQRLPLGTSYPDVADYLANLLCNKQFERRRMRCLIDVTGIGRAIFDLLKAEIELRKELREVSLQPVSFVHGEKYNRSTGTLGKAYLVSRLQSLLQSGRVHAPDTAEVKAMLEELHVYEIKVSQEGKEQFGAVQGRHDDLATALGLSVLESPFAEKPTYSKRIF